MTRFTRFFTAFAIVLTFGTASFGEIILIVQVKHDGSPDKVTTYSRADLLKLPQHTVVTGNDYVDGKHSFSGPTISDVMTEVEARDAKTGEFVAANDYSVKIDVTEFRAYDPILALSEDDVEFSPRDKGPIWVMYPISDYRELQDPAYNSRLIWQLERIVFSD